MSLIQTRPYEEDLFVYDGTIEFDELDLLVDHSTFQRPKRYRGLLGGGTSAHVEKDTLTGLSSRTVAVTFETAFSATPVGRITVYRMTEMPNGSYREQDVLWGYASSTKVTISGFNIVIDDSESLTGVVVEYIFQ